MSGSAVKRADRQSGVRWKKPAEPMGYGQDSLQKQREKLGQEIRDLLQEMEETKRLCMDKSVGSIIAEELSSAKWDRFKPGPEKKTA
ncbi:hypothetical protein JXA56_03650 [Candidatus Micrarchaeota archaeon]|nr:hypothetical protein [Candidatus Micrarchaeota archaeon]